MEFKKNLFYNQIGWETGHEQEGYQGGQLYVFRNILPKPVSEGGLDNRPFPSAHLCVLPRNSDPSKWYHLCLSYSSTLQQNISHTDGLRVFSFNFGHKREDPLSANHFEILAFGYSMQGLITDVQIYDFYFIEDAQISCSTGRMEDFQLGSYES